VRFINHPELGLVIQNLVRHTCFVDWLLAAKSLGVACTSAQKKEFTQNSS